MCPVIHRPFQFGFEGGLRGGESRAVTNGSKSKMAAAEAGEGVGLRKRGVNIFAGGRWCSGVAGISLRVASTSALTGVAGISIGFLLEPGVGVGDISIGFLLEPGIGVGGISIRVFRSLRGWGTAATVGLIMIFGAGAPGSGL